MTGLLQFWIAHGQETLTLLLQHATLVLISTAAAILIGVPAGVLAARLPRVARWMLPVINVLQTIPSLALLGFLLPLPFIGGLGTRTALVTLAIYALLPIVQGTVTGIRQVDRAVIEAGVAMGMTDRQLLWMVELPLALPAIVAGIRVAAVIGVATATIAAAIGAGGLGEYIFRGLSMSDTTTILAGAVPAAALALIADAALGWTGRRLQLSGITTTAVVATMAVVAVTLAIAAGVAYARSREDRVVVGSKNFTEQVILGELVAQRLEANGLRVDRRLNLGGTFICDRALRSGEVDVYVEYTGTAVTAVFHEPVPRDPAATLERTRELYARAGITVSSPLGFNNTFTILVRRTDAAALNLHTIDDLHSVMSRWTPGFGYEFLQRDDGYPGLVRAYGLQFANAPRAMDLSLIYRALSEGTVDVIAGDATSAQIDALGLASLVDSRKYFPAYEAVPVVRSASLLRQPAISKALADLAGRIAEADMRRLNAAVDIEHRDVKDVVREFLEHRVPQR